MGSPVALAPNRDSSWQGCPGVVVPRRYWAPALATSRVQNITIDTRQSLGGCRLSIGQRSVLDAKAKLGNCGEEGITEGEL